MFKVEIVASGDGSTNVVGTVETLTDAKALVDSLEARYAQWEKDGYPALAETDALCYYEGCDIFAQDLATGVEYIYDENDEWTEF